jgi:hypothetical protein
VRWRLIIGPEISQAIGGFGLDREALLRLYNVLRLELEVHADNYRQQRDHANPDLYFWFELTVWADDRPRGFRFTVDDARAPDHLFLAAAEEI